MLYAHRLLQSNRKYYNILNRDKKEKETDLELDQSIISDGEL